MPEITDDEVAAEARAMIRETIERSGWYPSLPRKFRQERIEQDVERNWHLMVDEARKRLEARHIVSEGEPDEPGNG